MWTGRFIVDFFLLQIYVWLSSENGDVLQRSTTEEISRPRVTHTQKKIDLVNAAITANTQSYSLLCLCCWAGNLVRSPVRNPNATVSSISLNSYSAAKWISVCWLKHAVCHCGAVVLLMVCFSTDKLRTADDHNRGWHKQLQSSVSTNPFSLHLSHTPATSQHDYTPSPLQFLALVQLHLR